MIIGTLACLDPKTGDDRAIVAVNGSPAEADAVYARIRPHMNPRTIYAPSIELGPCTCVVPRLYAAARELGFVVRNMSLGVRETGERLEPCAWCDAHRAEILKGVQLA